MVIEFLKDIGLLRSEISVLRVTHIAPWTTLSSSWILTPGPTPIQSGARGVASRFSWVNTTMGKTTNTIWLTTCLRRGARHEAYHLTYNSLISSQTSISILIILRLEFWVIFLLIAWYLWLWQYYLSFHTTSHLQYSSSSGYSPELFLFYSLIPPIMPILHFLSYHFPPSIPIIFRLEFGIIFVL